MLPRFATERIGVGAAEVEFSRWGWMFRTQPILDHGIDAQVEPCWNGAASGRLIALQIKAGRSWFRESADGGWIYRGKMKHLRYWLRHCLPVILLMHDPASGVTYWAHITEQAVEYTDSGWKILVPATQTLGPSARPKIAAIAASAGGVTADPADELYRRFKCSPLLGGPLKLERAARRNGCRVIDARSEHQQEFQALLLWCLLSPRRSVSWDTREGRAFRDMQAYYNWVSPQPGYLAIGCTVAARVAHYLLPDICAYHDGRPRCSGIPGLRFVGTDKGCIRLAHLPTGGTLELHESTGFRPPMMADLLRLETCHSPEDLQRHQRGELLWQRPELDEAEATSLADWALAGHASVLSAIMARIHVLWRYWGNGAELDMDAAAGCPRLSWWDGPSTEDLARLLVASDIEIAGARWVHGPDHTLVIALSGSRLELRGPTNGRTVKIRAEKLAAYQQRYLSAVWSD